MSVHVYVCVFVCMCAHVRTHLTHTKTEVLYHQSVLITYQLPPYLLTSLPFTFQYKARARVLQYMEEKYHILLTITNSLVNYMDHVREAKTTGESHVCTMDSFIVYVYLVPITWPYMHLIALHLFVEIACPPSFHTFPSSSQRRRDPQSQHILCGWPCKPL